MFYSNNQILHLCLVFCLYLHLSLYLSLYLSSGQEWRGSRLCVGKPPAIAITISINSPDILDLLLWPRLKSQAPSTAVTSLTAITGCSTRFGLLCNTFSHKIALSAFQAQKYEFELLLTFVTSCDWCRNNWLEAQAMSFTFAECFATQPFCRWLTPKDPIVCECFIDGLFINEREGEWSNIEI